MRTFCCRWGVSIGGFFAPVVRALMWVMFPISWPLGKLLDWILGTESGMLLGRRQLSALVDIHHSGKGFGGNLSVDEVRCAAGAGAAPDAAAVLGPLHG